MIQLIKEPGIYLDGKLLNDNLHNEKAASMRVNKRTYIDTDFNSNEIPDQSVNKIKVSFKMKRFIINLENMIITNIKLFICLFTIALLFSCKKESTYDPFPTNSGIPLIKEMSFYDSIGNFIQWQSMEYNSQGWIKLQRSYFPPHYDTLTLRYEYYPDRVIESQFDLNNRKMHKNIYELNAEGLAESVMNIDYKSDGDSVVILGEMDQYNSDGYMTEAYYLPDDTIHWFKDNNQISGNNIVSSRYSDKYGTGQLRTFTFYDNSVNTLGNYNMGIP